MAFRAIVVAVSLCAASAAWAGPLTPPAGPVAPTPGPEPRIAINATNTPGDADSLFKIAAPGSYYLTANVTGVVGKHGIEIAASGVTLNLNGFDLVGVPGMGNFDGVSHSVGNLTNIAVVNGSVRNWGQDGVDLVTLATYGCRVEGVRANGNVRAGIYVAYNSLVQNCTASDSQFGIAMASDGAISSCLVTNTSGIGFFVGASCTLTNCLAFNNSGNGINSGDSSTITNCSALGNAGDGILVNSDCTVINNTCDKNGIGAADGAGIHALGSDNRIESNQCTDSDRGIDVDGAGNFIIRNTCSGNTTNWTVAAGNTCLVVSAAQTAFAINGNSGGAAPGSTDPNANYSY